MNISYELNQLKVYNNKFFNYCYIVVDKASRAAFIVDPAWDIEEIIECLERQNAYPVAIVLTHSHYDHINLVDPIVKIYNSNVYMSKAEIDYYDFRCKNLNGLNDFDQINMGETQIVCIDTPGHTAGGMCYLLQSSLFTGDTIFIEGCGICSFYGGSPELMFNSIQRIKSIAPPEVLIYPGHSYGKVPGQPLRCVMEENIYFQIDDKKCFIDFRMRENQKNLYNFI